MRKMLAVLVDVARGPGWVRRERVEPSQGPANSATPERAAYVGKLLRRAAAAAAAGDQRRAQKLLRRAG